MWHIPIVLDAVGFGVVIGALIYVFARRRSSNARHEAGQRIAWVLLRSAGLAIVVALVIAGISYGLSSYLISLFMPKTSDPSSLVGFALIGMVGMYVIGPATGLGAGIMYFVLSRNRG